MNAPEIEPAQGGTLGVTARLLRRFLPGEARAVAGGLVLLLGATCVGLLQPWPLKLVLDSVIGNNAPPKIVSSIQQAVWGTGSKLPLLFLLCVGLLVIELLMGALNVLSAYVLHSVALRLVFKLRCALFDHIQRLSLAFHDSKAIGDSLYRITWDSYCIQSIFSEGVAPALTSGATLLGIIVILLSRDWKITLAAAAVGVPLLFLVRKLDKPMSEQSTKVHEYESDVSTRVQETLAGIRAVQAYGREDFESERFQNKADASLRANLRLTVTQTAAQAVVGLVLAAGPGAVIWLGARAVLAGRITAGDLVLMVAYLAMIFKPLETLAYTAGAVQGAAAGARRVLSVLESAPTVADAPGAVPLATPVRGQVFFQDVSFAYRQGVPVLQQINVEIPADSSVALVGASGTGKTTLASLLLRFYDPTAGTIKIDGQELRRLTLKSLRQNIALVTQEPILFAASVRENIAYGRPGATQEEIETAARDAGASDFIERLPERYETQMAERGATLSLGQRQRIAIARAFLKNAPILILDEPTSALDAETEEALMQALERLMKGRTTLIIAHRLSTVRHAEKIIVLKDGAIAETGSHGSLLARGGVYARLHELQFADGESASAGLAGEFEEDGLERAKQ